MLYFIINDSRKSTSWIIYISVFVEHPTCVSIFKAASGSLRISFSVITLFALCFALRTCEQPIVFVSPLVLAADRWFKVSQQVKKTNYVFYFYRKIIMNFRLSFPKLYLWTSFWTSYRNWDLMYRQNISYFPNKK